MACSSSTFLLMKGKYPSFAVALRLDLLSFACKISVNKQGYMVVNTLHSKAHYNVSFVWFLCFSFREKLWADVDLISANREVRDIPLVYICDLLSAFVKTLNVFSQVESYWQQCLTLPERIQEWQAYKDMKSYIKQYLDVFPILHKLASKVNPQMLCHYKLT